MASVMQTANRLHSVLKEGKGASMGCWQMLPGANVSRTLARSDVDWVLVDCEHGNIDGESKLFCPYPILHLRNYLCFFGHVTVYLAACFTS